MQPRVASLRATLGERAAGFSNPERALKGEWRLLKTKPFESGVSATDIALGMITELVAWGVESRVLVFLTFDRAWLASARSFRNLIGSQSAEQLIPKLSTLFLGPGAGHGVGEVAHRVQAAFEAEAWQGDLVCGGGLSDGATD